MIHKGLAFLAATVLTAASVVGLGLIGQGTADKAPVGALVSTEGMTYGEYTRLAAFTGEEDEQGWDCRVNGNAQCGDVAYELVCLTAHATPQTLCTLEGYRVR